MTSSAATTIRQRLDALKTQLFAVATRHGSRASTASLPTGSAEPCGCMAGSG